MLVRLLQHYGHIALVHLQIAKGAQYNAFRVVLSVRQFYQPSSRLRANATFSETCIIIQKLLLNDNHSGR